MSINRCDSLILEIGSLIIDNARYTEDKWIGLALMGNFSFGQERMSGYVYYEDGDFEARTPKGFDVLDKVGELREAMKIERNPDGKAWHQCLIHITKPGMKINVMFEYDDPERWTSKRISRDMSDYAALLKPPI
ncbi:MAG: hypothetical protein KME56_04695 [Candidatus Thiodiazotropha sp. (ex Ctena orbiculata)]|uniref:Uncharacterized protein n=1 Tax=Candidatus Thiodiazotropha taylori TaxID=2792791 RepID=A0A944QV90_9GAMM|nr:hypothetical protein [Candidatus Thiodiazotropha taylori]PUB88566.1 MAG: hypothetical protein DBP00_05405 [gamma proteobacterium symbiont of Ctena orbiculata]MBT2989749.1 hypothetical protein [Candidatus Thiodiazotropha taylori]MBT2995912.1 hypothetical protein [Candidatus Thiodiazotropha taylori]MBT2999227.1 hypothetical protein [Candidatus Thiodiazotropha taylori]